MLARYGFLAHHQRFINYFRDIQNSQTKTIIAIVISSILVSIMLFGLLWLSQIYQVHRAKISRPYEEEQQQILVREQVDIETKEKNKLYDSQRRTDLNTLKTALIKFRKVEGFYPPTLSSLIPNYLVKIPTDPQTRKNYDYFVNLDKSSYQIEVELSTGEILRISG